MNEFDGMLEGVLRETANPEPAPGFAMRMRQAVLDVNFKESDMAEMVADRGLRQVGVFPAFWEAIGVRPGLSSVGLTAGRADGERRSFGPVGWALAAHGVAVLLLGTWVVSKPLPRLVEMVMTPMVGAPAPVKMPAKALTAGGGGGQRSPAPAAQGRLPKLAETQIVPPKAAPVAQPKIAVEPTVVMQKDLKMAESTLPNLGMPNSPVVGTGSLGNGMGTGFGSGNGAGVGAGLGGNMGGGAMRVGGGVSAPVPVFMPDPEFSEEARKAKVSGNVLVYLWVDQEGRPTHVRVVRGIGMGLDERAVAAVKQYRFRPARKDGRPVTVEMNVEVNFQIF